MPSLMESNDNKTKTQSESQAILRELLQLLYLNSDGDSLCIALEGISSLRMSTNLLLLPRRER